MSGEAFLALYSNLTYYDATICNGERIIRTVSFRKLLREQSVAPQQVAGKEKGNDTDRNTDAVQPGDGGG